IQGIIDWHDGSTGITKHRLDALLS
ncbi:hypothetical protein D027_4498B, partial [Vibrio parahaemolyticus 861]